MMHASGFKTGVDLDALKEIEAFVSEILAAAKQDTSKKPH
jgi:hypothetical protein